MKSEDLPYTVEPIVPDNIEKDTMSVRELLKMAYGDKALDEIKKNQSHLQNDDGAYIWKQADCFVKNYFPEQEYKILFSVIEEDCIGYRCVRKKINYTIFVYAYGEHKTSLLDGDYCSKLTKLSYTKDSIVLVFYIHISREIDSEEKPIFKAMSWSKDNEFSFWQVKKVEGKNILDYFLRKEMKDVVLYFVEAYNKQNLDILRAIMTPNISINLLDGGCVLNSGVYGHLSYLFKEYGKLSIAYVRYNDVIYSSTLYLKGFGFLGFSITQGNNKISEIKEYKLDNKYKEILIPNENINSYYIDEIPAIETVELLKPETTQRFAVKAYFKNGELKKYVLPINKETENDEVICFDEYVFTDKIFANGWFSEHRAKPDSYFYREYTECGQGINWINGFSISAAQLYYDGVTFQEPVAYNEMVYENDKIKVVKISKWQNCSLWLDEETKLIKVNLPGSQAFNVNCIATFALQNGKRATSLEFNYLDSFNDGLALVYISGRGYGFINKNMEFVILPKYRRAREFHNGFAVVSIWDENINKNKGLFIDKQGREYNFDNKEYKKICDNSQGLFRVSNLTIGSFFRGGLKLAYHSDYEENAGLWGYTDIKGKEIIKPQYIYAFDFEENGLALVCKGKWELWDERDNTDGWWTEYELWGLIDKTGREVVPCKFDEIKFFDNGNSIKNSKYLQAHYGGWKNGKWGIIDYSGKWVVEPMFESIDYIINKDDCFAFYSEDSWEDVPMGIYSIRQNRMLLEPKFLDVSFMDDGNLNVEIYDKELQCNIELIIDRSGKSLFNSKFDSLYERGDFYETKVHDNNGKRLSGLIDKSGNEILPCKYDIAWNGFLIEERKIIFRENDKYGLMTFDEKIIIPPIYEKLSKCDDFLYVALGKDNLEKHGLLTKDGTTILPIQYESISVHANLVIARDNKSSILYCITRKD